MSCQLTRGATGSAGLRDPRRPRCRAALQCRSPRCRRGRCRRLQRLTDDRLGRGPQSASRPVRRGRGRVRDVGVNERATQHVQIRDRPRARECSSCPRRSRVRRHAVSAIGQQHAGIHDAGRIERRFYAAQHRDARCCRDRDADTARARGRCRDGARCRPRVPPLYR